jgi:hypothetical protein
LSAGSAFAYLLRLLLAFSLLAGPLAAEHIRASGSDRSTDHTLTILELDSEQMLADLVEPQGDPELSSGLTGPAWLALSPGFDDLLLDRVRRVRVSRTSWPVAPSSHRPCAAPPTGPPSV